MIDASPSFDAARGISGRDLVAYLDEEGWTAAPSKVNGIMIFSKEMPESDQRAEFIVPIKRGFNDERRRVADALRTISQIEGSSEAQIAEKIQQVISKRKSKFKEAFSGSRKKTRAESPNELVAKSIATSVRVLADSEIESAALHLRKSLGLTEDQNVVNIVALLENEMPKAINQFRLEVLPASESRTAYSTNVPPRLFVAEQICRLASQGDARSRYVLAHEIGHLWLRALSARTGGDGHVEEMESAEWQASQLARAFLMPKSVALQFKDTEALSLHCKVEIEMAAMRLTSLKNTEEQRVGAIRGFRQLISIFKHYRDEM